MRVLISQSAQDAAATVAALQSRGHDVLAVPLVTAERNPPPPMNLAGAQGFLVVNGEGARALADHIGVRTFPVFTDSELTAAELRRLGFKNVAAAKDDSADLARLVERELTPANGALIYACSIAAPVALSALLGNMGFAVRPWPLYSVKRVERLPNMLQKALLDRTLDAVVFLTAEEARAFVALIQREQLEHAVTKLFAVAAAPVVAAPLRALKMAGIGVPPGADLDAVLSALDRTLVDHVAEERVARERRAREEAERLRAEQERREQERLAQEQAEREKVEREHLEREKVEKEREERRQAEQARRAEAKAAKRRAVDERAERDERERERIAAEKAERKRVAAARAAEEAAEKERLAKERAALAEQERERIAAENAERERQERARLAADQAERARAAAKTAQELLERARIAEEQSRKEALENERLALERTEQERITAEKIARANAERERLVLETADVARRERERLALEKAERDRAARQAAEAEKAERTRIAQEHAERDRLDRERAAQEKRERDRAARAESERAKAEKARAAQEHAARRKIEKERLVQEKNERRRLLREQKEQERAAREAANPREAWGQQLKAWIARFRRPTPGNDLGSPPEATPRESDAEEMVPLLPPPNPQAMPLIAQGIVAESAPSATMAPSFAAPILETGATPGESTQALKASEPQAKEELPLEERPVTEPVSEPVLKTGPQTEATEPADSKPAARGGGRAARLMAEDAADMRAKDHRFKYLGQSESSAPESESLERPVEPAPEPEQGRSGFVRAVGLFVILAAMAAIVIGSASWWVPRVTDIVRGKPPSEVVAVQKTEPAAGTSAGAGVTEIEALKARVTALEQAIVNAATPDVINTLRQDLSQRLTAVEARTAGESGDAVTSLGDSLSSQAKQLTAVSARLATLEAAIGNSARLEDLSKRLNMLEGRTAEANSVLALSDRVTVLETTARRTMVEQSANVALLMAIAQWREAMLAGHPFALELQTAKALAARAGNIVIDDADFAETAARGVPTTAELVRRFGPTAAATVRAGAIPDDTAAWYRRILDRIFAIVTVRRLDGDAAGVSVSAILARAERRLAEGNLGAVVDEMNGLTGNAANAAASWLALAKARVAGEAAAASAATKALAGLAANDKALDQSAPNPPPAGGQ